jgi:hypothetical protein
MIKGEVNFYNKLTGEKGKMGLKDLDIARRFAAYGNLNKNYHYFVVEVLTFSRG